MSLNLKEFLFNVSIKSLSQFFISSPSLTLYDKFLKKEINLTSIGKSFAIFAYLVYNK